MEKVNVQANIAKVFGGLKDGGSGDYFKDIAPAGAPLKFKKGTERPDSLGGVKGSYPRLPVRDTWKNRG